MAEKKKTNTNPPLRSRLSLVGQKFARWTVLSLSGYKPPGVSMWACKCDCGTERIVVGSRLTNGHSRSCGCLAKEIAAKLLSSSPYRLTHGHCRRSQRTRTYTSYAEMKKRCKNPNCRQWPYYGAKGVKVCERWLRSFDAFLSDMGPRPRGRTLDRFPDPDGNYEPGNCRWATHTEQMRNRRAR